MIYLVEFSALAPVSMGGLPRMFYFASGNGITSGPSEDPPNTAYPPRLLNPGTLERHAWQPGSTTGRGAVSTGVIEIANSDGALDWLIDFDADGRRVAVWSAPDGTTSRSAFQLLFSGTIQTMSSTSSAVQINMRDRMATVSDLKVVTKTYGGSNVLPNGVDGTPSDLQGKNQPRVIGECENFTPPCVNTSKLIYQISDKGISSLVNVWTAGYPVTTGTLRASLATLIATAPTAGTYDWYLGSDTDGAYFRLGSAPGSQAITAYAQEGASAEDRTVAQCMIRLIRGTTPVPQDFRVISAFDGYNSAVVGFYSGIEGATVGDALDAMAASVGASWLPTRTGQWQLQRLSDPMYGAPVAYFSASQLLTSGSDAITLQQVSDGGGIPVYEVNLSYNRNWTVLSPTDVAGAVTLDRLTWLGLQYRSSVTKNPLIWDPVASSGRNPLSQPLSVETLLRSSVDATKESVRLAALYGTRRRYVSFSVHPSLTTGVDIGATVYLTVSRYGFDSGRLMFVTGMLEDYANDSIELFCWC